MEVIIPTNTEVKLRGRSTLFRVSNRFTIVGGTYKYQLISVGDNIRHTQEVTAEDLIITSDRELYKKVIASEIRSKKELVKRINQEIKVRKDTLSELEKFSSDETEVSDLIDTFKTAEPAVISKLLKTKEHINFTKFLTEWV